MKTQHTQRENATIYSESKTVNVAWECYHEGEAANDNDKRVLRSRKGAYIANPYQQGSMKWKLWQNGYNYRSMVNDG